MKSPKSPAEAGPHTCGYAFSTLEAHRAHNAGGKCRDPKELDYVLHIDGRYGPYGSPIIGEKLPNDWKIDESTRPKAYLNVVKEQRGEPPKRKPKPKPEEKKVFAHLKSKAKTPEPKVKPKAKKSPSDYLRVCRVCGKNFERPKGRGRPPVKCEDCR